MLKKVTFLIVPVLIAPFLVSCDDSLQVNNIEPAEIQRAIVRIKIDLTNNPTYPPHVYLFQEKENGTIPIKEYKLNADKSNLTFVKDVKKEDKMWAEIWKKDNRTTFVKIHIRDENDIN